MVAEAKARGLALTGPDGLLKQFTKNVLETAASAARVHLVGFGRRAEALPPVQPSSRHGSLR